MSLSPPQAKIFGSIFGTWVIQYGVGGGGGGSGDFTGIRAFGAKFTGIESYGPAQLHGYNSELYFF